MKRKGIVFILVFIVLFAINACSSSIDTSSTYTHEINTSTTISNTTTTITLICDDGYSPVGDECLKNDNLNPFERRYTLDELTKDFDLMVRVLHHDNPLLFGNQNDIDEFIAQQRLLLRNYMTIYEFYRIVSPIAMAYKDGHTVLNLDYDVYRFTYDNALFFPLDVKIINEEIVVVGHNESYGIPLGSVITKINDKYADRLLEELLAYVPSDGDSVNGRYAKLNQQFAMFFYYLYPSDTFELSYRGPNSTNTEFLTIEAKTMADITAGDATEQTETLPFSSTFTDDYALLTLRTFSAYGSYSNSDFYDFFFDFFTTVDAEDIQNVIIDIRQNWGGDPRIASDLFSYIAAYSQPYFSADSPSYYPTLSQNVPLSEPHYNGNLYLLIDGITFSTAGHFAALVKYHDIATFIGSETSGSYAVADSHTEVRLSYTDLQLYTSQEIWKVAVEGLPIGRGVMPDYPVYPTWEDYVNEIDRVLLYTITLIES
ncbi:MAG: hypothetical protein JXL85_00670 [Bacilli bacterium]|nr:hypothetical protein [Bacilli bacterium]